MRVKMERGYTGAGHYDLDVMTDQALGMLVRGLLESMRVEKDMYSSDPELRIRELKPEEEAE